MLNRTGIQQVFEGSPPVGPRCRGASGNKSDREPYPHGANTAEDDQPQTQRVDKS